MLIASALVAVGVLAEDDTRLNRALQGTKVVTGLMSLWHAETRDKDRPVSVTPADQLLPRFTAFAFIT